MDVKSYKKEELLAVAEEITSLDIEELMDNLLDKDDKVRYPSFLILQFRSEIKDDIYPYWSRFVKMLESDNSYSRTIGLKLIAVNTKWDKGLKFKEIVDQYLFHCDDEKLITARLCIQGLQYVIDGANYDKYICDRIVKKLIAIDIKKRPDTNWKVMTTDIVNILMEIHREIDYKEIVIYLNDCLNGDILDKSIKKEITNLLS